MSIVPFRDIVDALDATLRIHADDSSTVRLDMAASGATQISEPFRAGVEHRHLSARAWIALEGTVAREFFEPLTIETATRLGAEFASLLAGPDHLTEHRVQSKPRERN